MDDMIPEGMEEMLPEEIREAIELQEAERLEKIQSIGQAIAKKRDDAVKGRGGSGIEQEWQEAEDAYEGIDDANRSEHRTYKPLSHTGSAIIPRKGEVGRSTIYLNITRPYTDAAAARLGDMLLPTDDKNWAIRPTPIPNSGMGDPNTGMAMPNGLQPAPVPPTGGVPPTMPVAPQQGMPGMQTPIANGIDQIGKEAREKAEKAEKQIEDWLVECQWHAEVRKVIEDCARLGTGILKGPFPVKRKRRKVMQTLEGTQMVLEEEIVPASKCVNPWNFYPDPNCGESHRNGQYCIERDEITSRQLKEFKGLPGYIDQCIDKVLEEGPGKKSVQGHDRKNGGDNETYEVWYYYGTLDRDDLECMGVDVEEMGDGIPAVITLVNDTAIKASLNPLDSGEFPYDMIPWQRRQNSPWGIGLPMQIRSPQRMLNGAARNMLDNAGLSGGPQIILRRNAIEPADGSWTLTPRKFWFAKEDSDMKSVQDAIVAINIPNLQMELMNIIQFAMKQAEDVTGMPALMQGLQGKAPETVGGMTMLQNNANSVLRRLARNFDDCITEPHITRIYEWILMYGPEDCQGDFQIDARGSSALVERDIQAQELMQMGQMVMNPAFGLSPAKWIREYLKSRRFDPNRFTMDEEEKQAMAQQQPPEAPQVAVAKIRAQTDMQKTQMQLEADMQKEQMRGQVDLKEAEWEQNRDTLYVQAEHERTRIEYEARMAELQIKKELEMLKYANAQKITLDQIKADLARDAAKLNLQRELSMASNTIKAAQVIKPPVEPPGRAPDGMAFQK